MEAICAHQNWRIMPSEDGQMSLELCCSIQLPGSESGVNRRTVLSSWTSKILIACNGVAGLGAQIFHLTVGFFRSIIQRLSVKSWLLYLLYMMQVFSKCADMFVSVNDLLSFNRETQSQKSSVHTDHYRLHVFLMFCADTGFKGTRRLKLN